MNGISKRPHRDALREAYDKSATARDASEMQDWKIRERGIFLERLHSEQKRTLLELGAGAGKDGRFFQENGLIPTCIDLSPAMVALCRQKGLNARVMDIAEIEFPEESFDAVYAMNSFLHLCKAEMTGVLARIHRLLKPEGLFYLGVYGGYDHEGTWEEDRNDPKRFFSFYSDEHIRQVVGEIFTIVSFNRVIYDPGEPRHFQSLTLRKGASHPAGAE